MLCFVIFILTAILLFCNTSGKLDNIHDTLGNRLTRSRGVTLLEQLRGNPDRKSLYDHKNEVLNKLFSRAKKRGMNYNYLDENNFVSASHPLTTNLFRINYSLLAKSLIEKANPNTGTAKPAYTLQGPEEFFEDKYEVNLKKLPLQRNSTVMPWSGYYWAFRYGIGSLRYSYDERNTMYEVKSGKRGNIYNYQQSIDKYRQPTVAKYQLSESNKKKYPANTTTDFEKYVNNYYSPTEKYDLLVGDENYTLTNFMKKQGQKYKDSTGDVVAWIGYCHGWSPASFLEKRPKHAVSIVAADGKTKVVFNPDDIEYMATTFWANADYVTRISGKRCSDISYCLSIDPGVFFIIIANQIGVRGKNLVFEPRVDAEIWNFPVYGYSTRFWNIIFQYVDDLPGAVVSRADLVKKVGNAKSTGNSTYNISQPDFLPNILKMANPSTEYFLGVELTINYVKEDFPFHGDQVWDDTVGSQSYLCVLFLDKNYFIIGGAWAQTTIPTFVWVPDEDSPATGPYDKYAMNFTGTVDQLKKFKIPAAYQSAQGTVLKSVMQYLVDKAAVPVKP